MSGIKQPDISVCDCSEWIAPAEHSDDCPVRKLIETHQARIEKLEAAIRECMNREGFDDTAETLEWWIEEHQPFEARTVKGE